MNEEKQWASEMLLSDSEYQARVYWDDDARHYTVWLRYLGRDVFGGSGMDPQKLMNQAENAIGTHRKQTRRKHKRDKEE